MEFNFTVDSAILGELGERLVESVHVALSELVKNSYDADATRTEVRIYYPNKSTSPTIEIIDNGTGMTLDEIRKYWMKIATTNKLREDRSKIFGRPLSGAKGIGRFSCRRLGTKLKLITSAKEGPQKFRKTEINFDWAKFKPGKDVTAITVIGDTKFTDKSETGTTLIISDAESDEWQKRGFDYFKRQITLMVANQGKRHDPKKKEDPGFNVALYCPYIKGGFLVDVRKNIYEAGWGTISAEVDDDGTAHYTLEAMGVGEKHISSKAKYLSLKGSNLKIAVLPIGRETYRDKSILAQWNVNELLEQWGGVQVRANGVRVYPYGDDDWLKIDRDRGRRLAQSGFDQILRVADRLKGIDPKRALLNMLSMKSYLGYVDLKSPRNFKIKANREGFVEDKAFNELIDFTRFAIDWSTIYRDFYIKKGKQEEAAKAKIVLEKEIDTDLDSQKVITSAAKVLVKELKSATHSLPAIERKRVERIAFAAGDVIEKTDKARNTELFQLRLIASTSTLLLIFSHEIKTVLGQLGASASSIESIGMRVKGKDGSRLKEIGIGLEKFKRRLFELVRLTNILGRRTTDEKLLKVSFRKNLDDAVRSFDLLINRYNIKISNQIPENLISRPIFRAEVYAIFLNALSNSIKSVIAEGGNRQIMVTGKKEGSKRIIEVFDNGIGLSKKHFEDVFVPFIADPENKLYRKLMNQINQEDDIIASTGNGIGLGIIREITLSKEGNVRFKTAKSPWKTCLEITL